MKRITLFVLVVLVFVLSACVAQPTSVQASLATPIPDALKVAINGVLLLGVMLGLQFVFDKVGVDLRGVGAAVAVALSEFVILSLQGVVDVIPAEYDMYVTLGFEILTSILVFLGGLRAFFQKSRAAELMQSGKG